MEIEFERERLPLLWQGDVIINEGSFAGAAAALALTRAGKRVAVVEPRSYLGREAAATLRTWLNLPGAAQASLPGLLAACLQASGWDAPYPAAEISLKIEAIKLALEDLLLAAGVKLIYASRPVGLLAGAAGLEGLVIANKSGRQALAAGQVIDTSPQALLARLAGATLALPESAEVVCSRVLEFSGVACSAPDLAVPAELGMLDNRVSLHAGGLNPGHVLVECRFRLPLAGTHAAAQAGLELDARRRTFALAEYLTAQPGFEGAYLGGASFELSVLTVKPLAAPDFVEQFPDYAQPLPGLAQPVRLADLAGPVRGLWCLNSAARLPEELRACLDQLVIACRLGESLGRVLGRWDHTQMVGPVAVTPPPQPARSSLSLRAREWQVPQRGRRYAWRPVEQRASLPGAEYDLLVAGGGTAGAMAAIQASRQGARTCLVEMHPELGGTGTIGGVHSYWFGQRGGFVAQLLAALAETHRRIRQPLTLGDIPRWNIQARAQTLRELALAAGVQVITQAQVYAVLMRENAVAGALVSTPCGPTALLAKLTIDATGDGDLAAFAGAEFSYGSVRDHLTMWYSLGNFTRPGVTRNNFTSTVDVSNVEDYTRAILAGRRRGSATYDHGIYLAPRESRHILGGVQLTHTDQLLRRQWPDVICVAFSNHDIKGQTSSDWVRAGLIPPNLEIEIPLSALLPRRLENLLVVGKAISATHDALPAIRMQADVENLGGAAGCAAALALRQGVTLRQLDLKALQRQLVAEGVLPATVLERPGAPRAVTQADLQALIGQLRGDRPLYQYSDMEINQVFRERIPLVDICTAGPQCVPLLAAELKKSRGRRRLLLAQALALVGSPAGAPVLLQAVQRGLSAGSLPEQIAHIRHTQLPPDQGAMPELVYLLYCLGMARSPAALPVYERVITLLADVTAADLRSPSKGIFNYLDAVCFGLERIASPQAGRSLAQLASHPTFAGNLCREGYEVDYFKERIATLELVIARTLARCGQVQGLVTLIEYLQDARALLAEHAHAELVSITGQDFGKEPLAWYGWLETAGDALPAAPYAPPTDAQRAWGTSF